MHLAAALGVRQVAIFGSTDWRETAPFTDRAKVVREPVECAPCMQREMPDRPSLHAGGFRGTGHGCHAGALFLKPAIFMDRDGTLSHEVGYVNHLSRFRLLPWTVDAVRLINQSGWLAVVVTNQAGVARGYFPESLIHEVHGSLRASLAAGGAHLDGLYFCPHHPTVGEPPYRQDCDCRKPRPGMLRRAEAELGVDLAVPGWWATAWATSSSPGRWERGEPSSRRATAAES
jgi:D,D-heptose 1,7-bisphosphate phosphatase